MMTILSICLGMIVTFLWVVLVHEWGPNFAAKIVGVKPDIFCLGFGPVLSEIERPNGERWQLRILPIGGYVKFAGDANAASLSQAETGPVVPGSLRSVPIPKRAFVVVAGSLVNLVFAALLFSVFAVIGGKVEIPWRLTSVSRAFEAFGLHAGNVVTQIDGLPVIASPDSQTPSTSSAYVETLSAKDGPTASSLRLSGRFLLLAPSTRIVRRHFQVFRLAIWSLPSPVKMSSAGPIFRTKFPPRLVLSPFRQFETQNLCSRSSHPPKDLGAKRLVSVVANPSPFNVVPSVLSRLCSSVSARRLNLFVWQ